MAEAAIIAEGLQKSYGKVHALRGVDLRAEQGSVLGLLGPNGAGKTTAVRILTTLLAPDGGSARVAGLDVVKDAKRLRSNIGLAGQYAAVDENLSGYENLDMVGRLYHLGKATAKRARATSCSSASSSPTPPTVPSRPTRAACGAGWTSPPRSSPARPCCSSTSRPPAWTRAAASACGRRSRRAWPRARPSC